MDKEICFSHDFQEVYAGIQVATNNPRKPFKSLVYTKLLECKNCEALAFWNNETGHKSLIKTL